MSDKTENRNILPYYMDNWTTQPIEDIVNNVFIPLVSMIKVDEGMLEEFLDKDSSAETFGINKPLLSTTPNFIYSKKCQINNYRYYLFTNWTDSQKMNLVMWICANNSNGANELNPYYRKRDYNSKTDSWVTKKPADIVKEIFIPLLSHNFIPQIILNDLLDKHKCHGIFGLQFPVLSEEPIVDSLGNSRTWTAPCRINGDKYYVTSEWYDDNKPSLIKYINDKFDADDIYDLFDSGIATVTPATKVAAVTKNKTEDSTNKIIRVELTELFTQNQFEQVDIDALLDRRQCDLKFGLSMPVLVKECDEANYFNSPIAILDHDYYIYNHWTEKNSKNLKIWIKDHAKKPETTNDNKYIDYFTPDWKALAPGLIAQNVLYPLLQAMPITEDFVKTLKTAEYALDTFGLSFPLLSTDPYDEKGYGRYYKRIPFELNGETIYLCSQWYAKNKTRLIEWIEKYNQK